MQAFATRTRVAIEFIDMPIVKIEADETNGIINVIASGKNLGAEFFNATQDMMASLVITDGENSITSDIIQLIAGNDDITVTSSATYSKDTKTIDYLLNCTTSNAIEGCYTIIDTPQFNEMSEVCTLEEYVQMMKGVGAVFTLDSKQLESLNSVEGLILSLGEKQGMKPYENYTLIWGVKPKKGPFEYYSINALNGYATVDITGTSSYNSETNSMDFILKCTTKNATNLYYSIEKTDDLEGMLTEMGSVEEYMQMYIGVGIAKSLDATQLEQLNTTTGVNLSLQSRKKNIGYTLIIAAEHPQGQFYYTTVDAFNGLTN